MAVCRRPPRGADGGKGGTLTRTLTIAGALLGALFHLAIVGAALLVSGGVGEDQGWTVIAFDFPLFILLNLLPDGGRSILYDNVHSYVRFFLVAGTVMYATLGALVGYTIGHLWQTRGRH